MLASRISEAQSSYRRYCPLASTLSPGAATRGNSQTRVVSLWLHYVLDIAEGSSRHAGHYGKTSGPLSEIRSLVAIQLFQLIDFHEPARTRWTLACLGLFHSDIPFPCSSLELWHTYLINHPKYRSCSTRSYFHTTRDSSVSLKYKCMERTLPQRYQITHC